MKTLEERVEELERKVQALEERPVFRRRPANWPKLDANGEPYGGRFDDDAITAGKQQL